MSRGADRSKWIDYPLLLRERICNLFCQIEHLGTLTKTKANLRIRQVSLLLRVQAERRVWLVQQLAEALYRPCLLPYLPSIPCHAEEPYQIDRSEWLHSRPA